MVPQPFPVPRVLMEQAPYARALLRGGPDAPDTRGEALLYPFLRGTLLLTRVTGLPRDGFLGFHVHEAGSCDPAGGFQAAGGHYNPTGAAHPNHAGDLPPLLSAGGQAYAVVYTDRFHPSEVLGRALIIHGMPDDFHSQPAGDAGMRIACGVIERTVGGKL